MPTKRNYTHIISLGYNCEVAYELTRKFHFLDASLFSWSYSHSLSELTAAIEDLESIAQAGFISPDPLYECVNTHVRFHGRSGMQKILAGNLTAEEEKRDKAELTSRLEHLKAKFIHLAADKEASKLYVLKVRSNEHQVQEKLAELKGALQKWDESAFDLLIVVEKGSLEIQEVPHLFVREVEKFSPEDQVSNLELSDPESWKKIFSEFEIPNSIRLRKMLRQPRYYPIPFRPQLIKLLKFLKR